MVNFNKLDFEIQYALDHPREFNMDSWIIKAPELSCGTVGCLAGNTVIHEGFVPVRHPTEYDDPGDNTFAYAAKIFGFHDGNPKTPILGELVSVDDEAASLLELDLDKGDYNIFLESDIYGVINYRNRLADREGVDPEYFGLPTYERAAETRVVNPDRDDSDDEY